MRTRRSFFLLEVMVAVILIGVFAYVSLHSLYHSFNQQQKLLDEIEYARLVDLKRMHVIAMHWNQVKELEKEKKEYSAGPIQAQIGKRCPILNPNQMYDLCARKNERNGDYLLSIIEQPPKKHKRFKKMRKTTYHYLIRKDQEDGSASSTR